MTTISVPVTGPGTVTIDVTATFVPAVVAPPSNTAWVYHNGVFSWPGDYNFGGLVTNYADTVGNAPNKCISATLHGAWGGWLPYAPGTPPAFDSTPYTKLTFALKPTVATQKWHVYFVKQGDIPVGISIDPVKYGPPPIVGQWGVYIVPLADLGVLGTSIYKFAIQDQTGLVNNLWYIDQVGFLA